MNYLGPITMGIFINRIIHHFTRTSRSPRENVEGTSKLDYCSISSREGKLGHSSH